MPTRNVNLTDHDDHFVESLIASGRYKNASEVMLAGLRLLEQRIQEDEVKLETLRNLAAEGFTSLDKGEGRSIDDPQDLERLIRGIGRSFEGFKTRRFVTLLESMALRPAMYVGGCSLRHVANYISGYDHALQDGGLAETPLAGWVRWVEWRFLICHPAWHWTRILLHFYGVTRPPSSASGSIQRVPE